ncbi:CoA transferase [Azorhizobium doebereinerae]|uniref:CoA transferase n=1 Tax=Azorhizobium doebereinerae TaxID=281091 RepID=UPI000417F9AC|nr:CoA transferase [Azorhizobium doebereinerae]
MPSPLSAPTPDPFSDALAAAWAGLGGDPARLGAVRQAGGQSLPSAFAVSDLAAASVATVGLALADYAAGGGAPPVLVDRRLASLWFGTSLKAQGWTPPPVWDPIAGDYPMADGWIRLHTNAPHHRDAALAVLGVAADRTAVAGAVAGWRGAELEAAVVDRGGCAALMRSRADWLAHPQGQAVAAEPLFWREDGAASDRPERAIPAGRPLAGLKVLDLTRVLAGPVATRVLAGFGADVLRIDPPFWDEPAVLPDTTLGKRCARLDLRLPEGRARLAALLGQADVMVHGYRSDALERLGLGPAARQAIRPGLVDVSLDAYGWTGPWARRRGFDSLVQMSCGIAEAGMRAYGTDRPKPLPVQALDHAAGYLLAAAALRGLALRRATGRGSLWRTSLARVAELLVSLPAAAPSDQLGAAEAQDYAPGLEQTGWGPAHRLRPPLLIPGLPMAWARPAGPLGMTEAAW